ncbi:hypothetical protein [Sphingomonas sp. VNH70]|uniref:hypothetical protein n=1 Tax=Sphingomonas silueang TaxID=3156617 RepID=UPI0032B5FD27
MYDAVFARLRDVMLGAATGQRIAIDEPGNLLLHTPRTDPKTGKPVWFGTVTTRKRYVAVHVIPLYDAPELADGLSPALAKRRQGKTCFNFTEADEPLFAELAGLIGRAAA